MRGTRPVFNSDVYGVVDPSGEFQVFYSPRRMDAQPVPFATFHDARELSDTDEAFFKNLATSGHNMNLLVGVSMVAQSSGFRYEPKSPDPFGDDVPLTIVRKAGQTRKRLEATLTQHLNAGSICGTELGLVINMQTARRLACRFLRRYGYRLWPGRLVSRSSRPE